VNDPLPLAAAAARLRRRPGRPRKVLDVEPGGPALAGARLLDLQATAAYLSVSAWTVRDLEAAGMLRRVRIPLPRGRELRKLLFDRDDLDQLIVRWKDEEAL
jgi:hypothetical protein